MEEAYVNISNFFQAMLILTGHLGNCSSKNVSAAVDFTYPLTVKFILHCSPSSHVRFVFNEYPKYDMDQSIGALVEAVKENPKYTTDCMLGTVDGVYLRSEALLECFIEKMSEFKNEVGTSLDMIYKSIIDSLVTSNSERVIFKLK